jgi:hypothetical protein
MRGEEDLWNLNKVREMSKLLKPKQPAGNLMEETSAPITYRKGNNAKTQTWKK